jgi:hypothetical protein
MLHRPQFDYLEPRGTPATIIAIGHQALNYDLACSLTNWPTVKMERSIIGFECRLWSRCYGLLESIHYHGVGIPLVSFTHRTVRDYLYQQQHAQNLLKSEMCHGFDVNVALLVGMSAHLMVSNDSFAISHNAEADVRSIFLYNNLAEQSTGRHQTELLETIDRQLTEPNPTIKTKPGTRETSESWHWSSYMFDGESMYDDKAAKTDILAFAIYYGAMFYLREAISRHGGIPAKRGQPLLYYAVFPVPGNKRMSRRDMNFDAAEILLAHGEDPTHEVHGCSPWQDVLTYLMEQALSRDPNNILALLSTMTALAAHAKDRQKCRMIQGHINEQYYNAPQAIRELLLGRACCSGNPVSRCTCVKSKAWRLRAEETMQFIEPRLETIDGSRIDQAMAARPHTDVTL